MPGFSEGEKATLRDLNKDGLSIIKLSNYLRFDPARESTIKVLIKHGADATLINDVLRLSVFPANNAVELAYWAHNNKIRIEDVLGKVKDFSAGKAFHQLLIRRLDNGEGLSGAILDHLFNQAESATKTDFPTSSLHPDKNAPSEQSIGESFFMAAESIMETIPSEKPIVLLGRDAGPLVPLLRALGRDNVHYFIWSRLQCGDPQTGEQWLKEIPPGAAVIDTGYMGSIINTIQHLDPGTSGYLLASSNPAYPALLKTQENNVRVDQIEQTPKLIVRGSAHNKNGGVIARKRHSENDVDSTFHDSEKNSRWSKERNAREILRAAGLDEWDAWRYSSWVGLTPKDRLGLRTDAQVQQHYQDVARARNTATASAQ